MKKGILTLLIAFLSTQSFATNTSINAVPTNWLLQNYIPNGVVVYYSGSQCGSGKLVFGSNATLDDKNRFWSVIMAAKVASKPVTVWYENANAPSQCVITSFTLNPE